MKGELVTIKEAAEILAVKVSTMRKWCFFRTIPFYKIGSKTVRFRRTDIENLIQYRPVIGEKK